MLTNMKMSSGATVVGLDNSPAMIDEARRHYPQIEFQLADAHDFDVTESFDAVFSNAALHWIKEPSNVVGCISRALNPNGRNEACEELDTALRLINHCVNQLTDDQLWWRPSESMNSTANLLLHLCGNLRQWIVSGAGGTADGRERQKEFDARSSAPKTELRARLAGVCQRSEFVDGCLPHSCAYE